MTLSNLAATRRQSLIRIGGFVPFSTSDYPGQLCAVIFTQGCPWRCRYCHNGHLQSRQPTAPIQWADTLDFLHKRMGLLDAVVFSGGEPTLEPQLLQAVRDVNSMGYKVGLHTTGMYPRRLAALIPYLHWVGLDIKAAFAEYDRITQARHSADAVLQSLDTLLRSDIALECRSTIHPELHTDEHIVSMAMQLHKKGVLHYVLQIFRPEGCQDTQLIKNGQHLQHYPHPKTLQRLNTLFPRFELRRA